MYKYFKNLFKHSRERFNFVSFFLGFFFSCKKNLTRRRLAATPHTIVLLPYQRLPANGSSLSLFLSRFSFREVENNAIIFSLS